MEAVKRVAKLVFENGLYKKIIVLDLPKARAFMHLDTVFTNIDYDKFIVHPLIFDSLKEFKIFELTAAGIKQIDKPLIDVLNELTGQKVKLIKCGGDDVISSGREQ
jgi:arginine deiminase